MPEIATEKITGRESTGPRKPATKTDYARLLEEEKKPGQEVFDKLQIKKEK